MPREKEIPDGIRPKLRRQLNVLLASGERGGVTGIEAGLSHRRDTCSSASARFCSNEDDGALKKPMPVESGESVSSQVPRSNWFIQLVVGGSAANTVIRPSCIINHVLANDPSKLHNARS
jgi:hypothetical protein